MLGHANAVRSTTGPGGVAAGLLLAVLLACAPSSARAQTLVLSEHRVYLSDDTLTVDLTLDSLFSSRSLDAIASGMTTSITVEARLEGGRGFRPRDHTVAFLLEHDIWEGRYRAIREGSAPDTLNTPDFQEAQAFCSTAPRMQLGPLPDGDRAYVLKVRVSVNPITEAQRRRTRSWLNFLDRGSILELFFSLDTPTERTDWLEVRRFQREDLP